ncbi:MAG: alpha/beta fold hydrolase [Acidimicrobiales bacterium]
MRAEPDRPQYDTRLIPGDGGTELAVDVWALPDGAEPEHPGFVLIHGLASNARLYDGVAALLVEAHHATVTLDLRGHGRSGKPEDGYDFDTMCADVAAVLDTLAADLGQEAFGRPVVVGQSFGGNLVLELAARYPERLAGVACIDGGTIDLGARFHSWDEVSAALAPPKIEGTPYEELERRAHEWNPDWPEAGIRGSLANFEVRPDGTVAPWLTLDRHLKILRSMWESPATAVYPKVKVPVLLLPVDSPGAPAAWSEAKREGTDQALAALERAQVHWFSPADHDVHAQHPDLVAAVLLGAVGSLFT